MKHQKLNQDDIISTLPKASLHRILSLLPMKDAVRTSILSKRWELLWTSMTSLKFTSFCQKRESFMNFVDRAIFLQDSSLKQFHLCCDSTIDEIRRRGWITAMVRRNVEEININWLDKDYPAEDSVLPYCLFASSSLIRLSLLMYREIKFPPSIHLSNLKHLVLEGIYFTNRKSIPSLLSGCPMLETMSLLVCSWVNVHRVPLVCGPKLFKLEITEEEYVSDRYRTSITICGPSLRCFHYKGDFYNEYCLYDLPSLEEGMIDMDLQQVEWIEECLPRLYKLLAGLSHVKKLSISPGFIEVPNYQRHLLPYLHVFSNLSILSFISWSVSLDWEPLMTILQNTQCLETLRFERGIILPAHCNKDKGILEPVPTCFSSSLKRLEMLFDDSHIQRDLFMNAAEVLLERAVVLEKFVVYLPKDFTTTFALTMDKEKLIKDVIELPRASQICQVEFADC